MFIVLAFLGHLSRRAASAWRQYRRNQAAYRELESLDYLTLRDLGLSHRSALEYEDVDRPCGIDEERAQPSSESAVERLCTAASPADRCA
jgi:uncharacterized protein YjiS (DUF1127 family)